MTLQHTQQKIEEDFKGMSPKVSNFGKSNPERIQACEHLQRILDMWWYDAKGSYMDFFKETVRSTLQDFIQQTSVEYREESGFYEADMNDGFNEAVRLQREKQDNYLKQ